MDVVAVAGQLAPGSAPFRITGGRQKAGQLASGSAGARLKAGLLDDEGDPPLRSEHQVLAALDVAGV
jgi:hypothetical protein